MVCPNYKTVLKNESKYCPRCGMIFESDDVYKHSKDFEADYLERYLDGNIRRDGIPSFKYFIFGFYYAIYKRMYKTSIFLFLAFIILITFIINSDFFVLFSIRYYPVGMIALFLFFAFAIRYFFHKLKEIIMKECRYRLYKITKREIEDKNEIINLIELDTKNNLKGLIFSILVTIIIILSIFLTYNLLF